jgi:endonuclease YncB( thermonuclease family)
MAFGSLDHFFRKLVGSFADAPIYFKLAIFALVAAYFVVLVQWDAIFGTHDPESVSATTVASEPGSEAEVTQTLDDLGKDEAQAFLIRRMSRIVINEPKIDRDGKIDNDGKAIYLHGIQPFDAKSVCTRSSGERWACGLQAYAALRNGVAKKTIVCEPKAVIEKGLSATCRVDDQDVAILLIQKGLVELAADSNSPEQKDAQANAQRMKLGIWDR